MSYNTRLLSPDVIRLPVFEYLHILSMDIYGRSIPFTFSQEPKDAGIHESIDNLQNSGTTISGPGLQERHGNDWIGIEVLEYCYTRIGKRLSKRMDLLHVSLTLFGYHSRYLNRLRCRFYHTIEKEIEPSKHVTTMVSGKAFIVGFLVFFEIRREEKHRLFEEVLFDEKKRYQ